MSKGDILRLDFFSKNFGIQRLMKQVMAPGSMASWWTFMRWVSNIGLSTAPLLTSLGVTLYCMLTGGLPFNTENPIELFERVQNEE